MYTDYYTRENKIVKCYFSVPTAITHRICTKCRVIKPLGSFYRLEVKVETRCIHCLRSYQSVYTAANAEAMVVARKARYAANPQKFINMVLAEAKKKPEKFRIRAMNRHCDKLQRTPKWLTVDQKHLIAEFYKKANYLTKTTGCKYEVDHIVPLRGKNVSGLHVPWNLQVITKSENTKKGNRF